MSKLSQRRAAIGLSVVVILALFGGFLTDREWLSEHLAELIGAIASAGALAFVAHTARIQSRQVQSQEVLTAFNLARGDLETLSCSIATRARLVIPKSSEKSGKLEERQAAYDSGDRTAFARLFGQGAKIRKMMEAEPPTSSLNHQVKLYIRLFESVCDLTSEPDLRRVLLQLPLGRAYCALKIAANQDPDGVYRNHLRTTESLEPETEAAAA